MNYNHSIKNDSTVTIRVMCAVVFVAFSFLWLYYFQADTLSVAQHALSHGQTNYNRLVGAVVITLVLLLLQLGVYSITRLQKYSHAFTYFPSMLVLAVLTSVDPDIDRHFSFGSWLWLFPLLLVLWGGFIWLAKTVQAYEPTAESGFFSRRMWVNVLTLALMICGVAVAGNTNAVFHFRTHVETALLDRNFDEALRVGKRSVETDGSLMMVRMYALSRDGQLADRLFEYPLVPSADAMLPTAGDQVRMMIYPIDSLYRHLGAIPRRPMQPMEYLTTILRTRQAKPAAIDYLLCGYLLNKDLDGFVRQIGSYYAINDSLPRHYREALVLYTHLRSHPFVVYHDPILDVDFEDFRKLEALYPDENERKNKVMEHYANSYWYYYSYL